MLHQAPKSDIFTYERLLLVQNLLNVDNQEIAF